MEDTEAKQGFKIKDRRRFDSAGNEVEQSDGSRSGSEKAAEIKGAKPAEHQAAAPADQRTAQRPEPQPANAGARPTSPLQAGPRQAGSADHDYIVGADESETQHDLVDGEEGISFHSFIMSLAHQALMLLGEIPGPDGRHMQPDKGAAKQTIDILSMLELKTRGNLSVEEKHFLEEILHELRLRFVRSR